MVIFWNFAGVPFVRPLWSLGELALIDHFRPTSML
jgi:hypothetical protein